MRPVTHKTLKSSQKTIRTALKVVAICLIAVFVPLALYVSVKSEDSARFSIFKLNKEPKKQVQVTVQATGRGNPYLNVKDGRQMPTVSYRGSGGAINALQSGTAGGRTLAAADLNGDAAPDLVVGFANGGAGIVTVQKGNPEGFAPQDDSVFQRMHQGYNPSSLLPTVETYQVSSPVDFLQLGDFNNDGNKDVLIASRDGSLRLLAGDGQGGLGAEQQIDLPGNVTSLTAGEFRAADGRIDVAVGVHGFQGPEVLVFDGAAGGFESAPFQFALAARADSVEFGELDSDPFMDLAIANGAEINIVHGWGRKVDANPDRQVERIPLAYGARSIAVDNFTWDRQGTREIAVLAEDGSVRVLEHSRSDKRALTDADRRERAAARAKATNKNADVEVVRGWSGGQGRWSEVSSLPLNATTKATARGLLAHGKVSPGETNALMVPNGAQRKLEMVRQVSKQEAQITSQSAGEVSSTSLDVNGGTPIAMVALPQKLNGSRDIAVLTEESVDAIFVPIEPNAIFGVNTTSDHAPDGACNAAPDCTLREAVIAANSTAGADTINLPAGTYQLTIIGNTNNLGAGEGFAGDAAVGDLDFRDTPEGGCAANKINCFAGTGDLTTLSGAGSGTTFIVQTTANDRVIEPNPFGDLNFDWTVSGVTIAGGRDTGGASTGGGGGFLSGSKDNTTTVTNVVFANNRAIGAGGTGGGAIQNQGGTMTITNTVFGGAVTVAACPAQTSTNCGNSSSTSGGGIGYSPGDPFGRTPSAGTLTIQTTSSFQNNLAGAAVAGGGGGDFYTSNLGTGSVSITGTTFTSNLATDPGVNNPSGGAMIVESIATTVTNSSFTNNSAENRGGAIQVAGGSLHLDGTNPSITFSGNTAGIPSTSSISTTSAVTVSGTNVTIGGDIEIATNGTWTNNAGSTISPNNITFQGTGSFTGNNSTTNVTGNFSFGGTGTFNAGTGLFNFNGTTAQSITNTSAGPITFFNLTDSNTTQPLTVNQNIAVSNTLNVNGANAIFSPVAGAVISGTGTLTGTGTARASRTAATADFLNQYTITNKTLTNLQIDYNGAGAQTVNNTPSYSRLRISGSGTKTLQGNTVITSNLDIAAATFASGNFNFALGGNWTNASTFTPGTGTVTFQGTSGTQLLTGATTFFNLTLNNTGANTDFGATTTTIGNDLVTTAGTMVPSTSTIIFTGVTDNAGAISGAQAKSFHNLQINSPAVITNSTGGNTSILNDYTNNGTFTQAAALTTTFASGPDGIHSLTGAGTNTFGNFTVNVANTVNSAINFNIVGAGFTSNGSFNAASGTGTFVGVGAPQAIIGDGTKVFSGLTINNASGVTLNNGTQAVDAVVAAVLTLTTDFTVASGAILQQGGTSAGPSDVIGTVRRTDLGVTTRSFGNVNNQVTVNTGTPPTQLDFNLAKIAPPTFPPAVKAVTRHITLTPVGGAGFSATLRLRYIDPTELTPQGVTESRLILWKNIAGNWTAQGGTVDTGNNFVTHSGITSFSEWAIAEGADLTLSKANNVSGLAVVGQAWNWTLTATNIGSPATFTNGQTIIRDELPTSNLNYGTPSVQAVSNITNSANINCAIASNTLTCTASGADVTFASNVGASSFQVVFSATPQAVGSYQNPRTGGGIAQIDPDNVLAEFNETNNSPTNNTVTVGKANTTTVINSDLPDPSVVGQPVTVTWNVTVNAPGSLGAALTGNVTVSDGTNQCVAAVSAGQCDVTFTSSGAKSITATYAGDTNYNGSASTPATAHTVNKADTTTTITSDNPDPSTPGQSVTVAWTVTANAPGAGTPTGTVTVTASGGAETCNAPVATGQCSIVLNGTGTRTLTATYGGDTNFNGSADTEDHQVCGLTVVTSIADSGPGSLRQIIADLCEGATITFDITGAGPHTITLLTPIAITKNLTISNTGIEGVTISGGGTTRVFSIGAGKTVGIAGVTISGGSSATDAGAILNDGTLTIVNSTLSGNAALSDGGAISNSATGNLTLINTTVSGNTAADDGGGVNVLGGTFTSINSTISNNTADSDNSTVGIGGGIMVQGGTVTLKNTIVAGNFNENGASDSADDIGGAVDAASSFNLIGDATTAGGLLNSVNNNIVGVAAGLGPLADNGGTTQTHALLSTSPAIEAGSNAHLPQDTFDVDVDTVTAETLPVDQRGTGFPRVADSADVDTTQTVDIGAFELHPSISDIVNQTTDENTVKNVGFNIGDDTGSLIATVTATSSNTTLVPNANLIITGSNGSRNLQITPATNQSGTTTITVTVTATNGRTAVDTFDLTVNSVNNAPAGTDNTVATNEDTAYTFGAADFGFTDPNDSPPNAFLAVKVTTLPGAGTLTNNNVAINAGDSVLVTAITGGLFKFTPVANEFGTPYTSFTFQVQDDGGVLNGGVDLDPTPNTMTINVNAINDPPSFTIAANPPAVAQDAGPQTVLNFATNISQGPNETGQILTFNLTQGTTTGTLTFSTAPAINATTGTLTYTATNGTNGTAQFSVTLSDNGSSVSPNDNESDPQLFTITVNAPNASPVVTTTAGNLAYTENDPATVIDPTLTVADADNTDLVGATVEIIVGFDSAQDTLAFTNQNGITGLYNSGTGVLTLTGTSSVGNYETALRSVTYQNSSENPTASRTIRFTASDGISSPGSATRGIVITAVNDAPVNTVPGTQSTNEDTAKVFSAGGGNQISVADVDLNGNQITITLTATNGTVSLSTTAGLTVSTGDGTDDPVIVATGLLGAVNTALNGLSFTPTLDFTGAASLQIISDDLGSTGTGGAKTDTDSVTINVNAANDPPVVDATNGNLSYTENDPATAIDPGLLVTDVDNTNLTGATVEITTGFVSAQDTLAFTNQLGITGLYNSGTGVLTLSGTSSVANYQTALRTVTYQNSSNDPTASRTITFEVSDGINTGSDARGITITAVNDPPVNTVPGAQSTNLDTPLTFSAGNGNQISVADADAGTSTIQVTLTVTNGTLSLSGISGLSFSFSDGNGTGAGDGTDDPTMTFRGTIADINTAMNGMTFTPNAAFTGAASLTITPNDLGNSGSGGPLTDTDVVNIQVATNISIQDSQIAEPESGTINMVFTVTMSAPAPFGGASVNFTTVQLAPALNHATAGQDYTTTSGTVSFLQGEQVKTILVPILSDNKKNEANETFEVQLSGPVGATIGNGTATGTILIVNPSGTILISEIRTSGPSGDGDDFVEIYNNSDTAHVVSGPGYGLFKMGADCSATPILIGTIPAGTSIPARGHFLFVGSAYSLANYGGSGEAAGDLPLTSDIENDRNVALFNTTSVAALSALTRLDAVGFGLNTGGVCDLLREGPTLTPLVGSVLEYSYFRDECGKKGNPAQFGPCPTGGLPKDSNNNNDDFVFVETTGANTVAGQRLGAPGPQNLFSGRLNNITIGVLLLDATKSSTTTPNRVRDTTPVANGTEGTLTLRRRFVNNTTGNLTRLRFRIVDISALTFQGGIADLRALTSSPIVVSGINDSATCLATGTPTTTPCSVTVQGTTLEQPPTQAIGGALNSTLSAGTITLGTPLLPGQSINLQLQLGVMKTGSFKFFFNVEALP